MTESGTDREHVPPMAELGAEIVSSWLVMGVALAATALVVIGWRGAARLYVGSAIGLALLLLPDLVALRRGKFADDASSAGMRELAHDA
jgi:hypothetical protein